MNMEMKFGGITCTRFHAGSKGFTREHTMRIRRSCASFSRVKRLVERPGSFTGRVVLEKLSPSASPYVVTLSWEMNMEMKFGGITCTRFHAGSKGFTREHTMRIRRSCASFSRVKRLVERPGRQYA